MGQNFNKEVMARQLGGKKEGWQIFALLLPLHSGHSLGSVPKASFAEPRSLLWLLMMHSGLPELSQ